MFVVVADGLYRADGTLRTIAPPIAGRRVSIDPPDTPNPKRRYAVSIWSNAAVKKPPRPMQNQLWGWEIISVMRGLEISYFYFHRLVITMPVHGKVSDSPRARLTKAYDVTIQRYRNSHTKIESKMHILRCMGSKICAKFRRWPLKFHTKFWSHTP